MTNAAISDRNLARAHRAADNGDLTGAGRYRFHGTCEYCDAEAEVTHFERAGLNVCDTCRGIHAEALGAADQADAAELRWI